MFTVFSRDNPQIPTKLSIVGEPTTNITAKAMNKSQTLLEINTAIAAMLDSN